MLEIKFGSLYPALIVPEALEGAVVARVGVYARARSLSRRQCVKESREGNWVAGWLRLGDGDLTAR